MIAQIQLGEGTPAELLGLLAQVGLEPIALGSVADATSAPAYPGTAAPPVALRVEFAPHSRASTTSPTNLTIAIIERDLSNAAGAETANPTADFICDNSIAAACFILARTLRLASPILTCDPRTFDVIRAAVALARSPARVLVEGEIGVGKDSLIKLIHAASGDPGSLLYAECAGLEAASVEAEIAPLLAQAAGTGHGASWPHGGIIFFSHLCELSPASQGRLLALLQECDAATPVSPVGLHKAFATRAGPARVRLLAAANRPMAAMVARGEFLAELHRLFDATLSIAPLRERPGDLPMLVRHALRTLNPALTLDAAAIRTLIRYPFPGNLRELTNFVTRIAIVPAKPVTRHPSGSGAAGSMVGRAEVIRQLDHSSLKLLSRSRTQAASALGSMRRPRNAPPLDSRKNATSPGVTGLALVTHEFARVIPDSTRPTTSAHVPPDSMRLATSAHPRRRNPPRVPKSPS
jgi:Sigma-54 interaction domain